MQSDRKPADPQRLTLDGRLGMTEAADLHHRLQALDRSRGLTVDVASVSHLGTLCLQVLVAAARDWQQAGHDFRLGPRSDAVAAALAGFAVPAATFGAEDVAWQ